MNLRKLFVVQLAVCVIVSNASYVVMNLSPWIVFIQAVVLSALAFAIVKRIGQYPAVALGAAVWIGLLSFASFLLSLSLQPKIGFDAGIYDRVPLLVGLVSAALCMVFWILLPWDPIDDEIRDLR